MQSDESKLAACVWRDRSQEMNVAFGKVEFREIDLNGRFRLEVEQTLGLSELADMGYCVGVEYDNLCDQKSN